MKKIWSINGLKWLKAAKGSVLKGLAAAVAGFVLYSCGTAPPDKILEGQSAIIFVRENSIDDNRSNAMRSNRDEFYSGSDLMLLSPISPSGEVTNLTQQYTRAGLDNERDFGAVADPEISLDGTKVLFSMKPTRQSLWHLYEMNIDGTDLVQLTDQTFGNDMDPTYLPNGQIMFASTRPGIVDEYERRHSPLLHCADRGPDGRLINIRQVSFNQSHETNPIVHSSGKVIFSRWEHLGSPNKFPLFVMNPDGTKLFVMYGNHSPRASGSRVFLEPRELSDGGLICSVMERNSPFEGGALAIIDISKSDESLEWITPDTSPFNNNNNESKAIFKTPYPIIDHNAPVENREKILFAMSPLPVNMDDVEERVDYGIYIMDKDGNNVRLIHNDPNYNDIDPVVVAPREDKPGGLPQVIPMAPEVEAGLANNTPTGMFFDGNVYDRAPNDGQMRPNKDHPNADGSVGQVKHLRVLEAVGMPHANNQRGGPIGNTNQEKQRVVGYAPVRSDGSFSVEVPANKSLHMQTLDENGMMLVNQRTWVQVMPGEKRLCTGCHDSHDRDKIIEDLEIQANDLVMNKATGITFESGFHNAVNVEDDPSVLKTDTLSFFNRRKPNKVATIQNIFDNRCVACHNIASPAGGLILENTAADLAIEDDETTVYDELTGANYINAENNSVDYVTDRGARESPLMWVMYNRQLDGNTDEYRATPGYDHTQIWEKDEFGRIDPFLPGNYDLLRMIEWIDAGTQYSNTIGPR